MGPKFFSHTASFVKGILKMIDSVDGNIKYIDINQAIIGRGDIYKPPRPTRINL